jgi:hypothetical protein
MAERQLPKLHTRVRFPSPAPDTSEQDGLDYVEWWRGRIVKGETLPKTANRDIGQLSRMLKDVSISAQRADEALVGLN